MKAPEVDEEDQSGSKPRSRPGQGWSDEDLENLFYHKERHPEAKADWGSKGTRISFDLDRQ
ncbi:hypothetical protein PHPALM_30107 [Phytophthora palmivora]|uniref:Uncharacterized protein n=1 Tax=Phytophthora palmivora TaxID=4796 RepID=A0A2P4X5W8_9STRA|nr:hypothetical protein PHPALM_30107 [Phytophthora palmivora]